MNGTTISSARVATARTLLFVPGHRHELFEKAARSGADAIVLDLEDSVPSSIKAEARTCIERDWQSLQALDVPLVIRMNATHTKNGEEDLVWLKRLESPAAVMVSKIESAEVAAKVHDGLDGVPVLPLIESAAGYIALPNLAAAPGVLRLVLGHLDFMADTGIGCGDDQAELASLRFTMAVVTRINGLPPAVDGVTVEIGDEQRLREDVSRALRFAFGGKLCIHPRQVSVVHEVMMPTALEAEWAHRVIEATTGGDAVQVDGCMVDLPVVLRARQVLARAAAMDCRSDR